MLFFRFSRHEPPASVYSPYASSGSSYPRASAYGAAPTAYSPYPSPFASPYDPYAAPSPSYDYGPSSRDRSDRERDSGRDRDRDGGRRESRGGGGGGGSSDRVSRTLYVNSIATHVTETQLMYVSLRVVFVRVCVCVVCQVFQSPHIFFYSGKNLHHSVKWPMQQLLVKKMAAAKAMVRDSIVFGGQSGVVR